MIPHYSKINTKLLFTYIVLTAATSLPFTLALSRALLAFS